MPTPERPKAKRPRVPPSPLPLPSGPGVFTVELDGALVFADGSCAALLAVPLLNLWSLGPAAQERVCTEFGQMAVALAARQNIQIVVESRPLSPEAVLARSRRSIITDHQPLRTMATHGLAELERDLRSGHAPDLRAYIAVTPAPEPLVGVAGALAEAREAVGLSAQRGGRKTRPEPDWRVLRAAVALVQSQCAAMDLPAHQLGRQEVLDLLWRTINPGGDPCRDFAACDDLALTLRPSVWREAFDTIQVGDVLSRSVYLLAPPDLLNPGWLAPLVELDCTMRLSWHLRGLDRASERRRLLRKRRGAHGVLAGQMKHGGLTSLDTEGAIEEAAQQALDLLDTRVGVVQSTLVVTVQAADREALDEATQHVRSIITTRIGGELARGRGWQRKLWQASLPLAQNTARGRAKRWRSETVATGLPFVSNSPGLPGPIPLGFTSRGHELVTLDLSHPSLPNWVCVVTGMSGSGKTTLSQLLTLWTLYQGGRASVIDRAGHYRSLIAVAGGHYVAMNDPEPPTVNLWDVHPGETLRSKIDSLLAAHEILVCAPHQTLPPRVEAALERAIAHVYAIYMDEVAAGRRAAESYPLERELVTHLEQQAKLRSLPAAERTLYADIAATLQPYVGSGRYAALVDRPTTVDLHSRLLCFDLQGLPERLYALQMFVIAAAMTERAVNATQHELGRPPDCLIVDEGWFLARYAGAGSWLDDMARRSRHLGLRFLFLTQQLSDLTDDPVARSIFNNASIRCLFRQEDARSGDMTLVEWLAQQLHISVEEAETLTQLRRGQMMLHRRSADEATQRGLVKVRLGELERWCFTSEASREVPTRRAMIAQYGGDVLAALLALANGERPKVGRAADIAASSMELAEAAR